MKLFTHYYLRKIATGFSQETSNNPIKFCQSDFIKRSFGAIFLTLFVSNSINCIASAQTPPPPVQTSPSPQIIINGRPYQGAWFVSNPRNQRPRIHLSDGVLNQLFGADLLSTSVPTRQPIQWFSAPTNLTGVIRNGYRYLDITPLAQRWGWQIQTVGNTITINTPPSQIQNLTSIGNSQPGTAPQQVIISLSRPTPWQLRQELPRQIQGDPDEVSKPVTPPNRDWTITLDGIADAEILRRYAPPSPIPTPPIPPIPPLPNLLKQLSPSPPAAEPLIQAVEVVNNQTLIRLSVPFGFVPRISTTATTNPTMRVEIVADALVNRQIAWASGITWRQQMVNLGADRFPVNWLEINPRLSQIRIRPILTNSNSQQGTAPLVEIARNAGAVAAINGGYFNRNNRLPLGAIRSNSQWLSGPILNRGAIAWNDSGQFYFGRLTLNEQLLVGTNPPIPILHLNSGYVQAGVSRYTSAWGNTYTTMTNNETILTVENNRITKRTDVPTLGQQSEPIPQNGYLLVLRGNANTIANTLVPNTPVRLQSATLPSEFNRYPHIISAGPLLLANRQIVLDGEGEKFSPAFIAQRAVRSAICTTNNGNILIAAVHNRAAGAGPTLQEHAQLMQSMGCVNALNLDGGSSTSLYLGGRLVDRSGNTAARVHNGIGIFLR